MSLNGITQILDRLEITMAQPGIKLLQEHHPHYCLPTTIPGRMLFLYTSNNPCALKQGVWVRLPVFSIQLFSFILNPYMDKGFENPEERDLIFCNEFFIIILYIILYILLYIDI